MSTSLLHYVPELLVSLAPVLLFLATLRFLDSYKLVAFRSLLLTLIVGVAAAVLCMVLNEFGIQELGIERSTYSRYVAPIVEETVKASWVIALIALRRVGFMVDGAIHGFAVGAGFAMTENVMYLIALPDADIFLWLIRGFGTAMMHGAATSMLAIVSKSLADRYGLARVFFFIPGLVLAMLVHTTFNHFFIPALLSTVVILVVLPLLMLFVFDRSERATRHWLGVGFDTDRELLEMLTTGNLAETRIGSYLQSLEDRFKGEILADMLCLLRLYLELSISAKGLLLMREAGFEVKPDPEIHEKFTELRFLEKSIGRTGKLALLPFLHTSTRDLWQLNLLGHQG
jgi:RsiW-degrading membrane proteinase PrsW (M82 family)